MRQFLTIILCFTLLSCEEDQNENIANRWVNHDHFFRGSKILLNSKVSSGKLIIAGIEMLSVIDTSSNEPIRNVQPKNERSLEYKPVIFEDFVMYKASETGSNPTHLVINSATHLLCHGGTSVPFYKFVKLHEIDSISYSPFDRINTDFHANEVGAFNISGQFLTSVIHEKGLASLCLITPKFTFPDSEFINQCAISEPSLQPIDLKSKFPYPYFRYVTSFGSDFFVAIDGYPLLKITETGEILETDLEKGVYKMFEHESNLYALTIFDGALYKSDPEGMRWTMIFSGGFPHFSEMDFFHVGESLCFYLYSQLFAVDLESGAITELDNSGLEGNSITSVSEFDNKVWITTLSGLYTKDIDNFFTERK